ncbi:MAG: hypothetical protein MZW92_77955 [Comamonadaceae bacterium]|nr:hypothetical protein [Comamonadaceae bacterium]
MQRGGARADRRRGRRLRRAVPRRALQGRRAALSATWCRTAPTRLAPRSAASAARVLARALDRATASWRSACRTRCSGRR